VTFRPARKGEARRVWRKHGAAVGTFLLAAGIVAAVVWIVSIAQKF
jgi:hypothetical protein